MASLTAPASQPLTFRKRSYSVLLMILCLGCQEECQVSHDSVQTPCFKAAAFQGNGGTVRAPTQGPAPSPGPAG